VADSEDKQDKKQQRSQRKAAKPAKPKPKKPKITNLERYQADKAEFFGAKLATAKTGLAFNRTDSDTHEFLAALIARLATQPPFSYIQGVAKKVSPNGGTAKPGDSLLGDLFGYLAGVYMVNQSSVQAFAQARMAERMMSSEDQEAMRDAFAGMRSEQGASAAAGPADPGGFPVPDDVPPTKEELERHWGLSFTDATYERQLRNLGYEVETETASL
jgi:hypothetical protein